MPKIGKKNITRKELPLQNRPRKRRKSARRGKKPRKGLSGDIGQALALTVILIVVSTVIAILVIGGGQKESIIPEMAALENPAGQGEYPAQVAAVIPPEMPVPISPQYSRQEQAVSPSSQEMKSSPVPAVKPQAARAQVPVQIASSQKVTPLEKTPVPRKALASMKPQLPVQAKAPPELPPKQQGTLVFMIDDAGNNLAELEPFLRFPGPLTIAVLPGLLHSAEAARRIRAAGKEVFLHQPMEALGGQAPGPGAVYAGMSAAETVAVLRQNLAEIGPVAGMNNHQGSKITMDRQMMETILAFCREQGIFFLDSRTTAETAVPAAARSLGLKIGERNIFIDNEHNRPSMSRYIDNGLALAASKGGAVMIGHAWSPELAPLLTELYPGLLAQGYMVTTAANFIRK